MEAANEPIEIIFQPLGQSYFVLPGTLLTEAAANAGFAINFPCGGRGTCGKCRVRILRGQADPTAVELRLLTESERSDGWRLACQTRVYSPLMVELASATAAAAQILTQSTVGTLSSAGPSAVVELVPVEIETPRRGDERPLLLRLEHALGRSFRADLATITRLAERWSQPDYRGTAVLCGDELLDFRFDDEPRLGRNSRRPLAPAVAVDLGTTTLAAALIDPADGRDLAVTAQLNPQRSFGDDVLSRIQSCSERPDALFDMAQAVVEAINQMIDQLCRQSQIVRGEIYQICIAGNTTMQQLFLGIDPSSLGRVPFAPVLSGGLDIPAAQAGIKIHPRGRLYVFPVIGGFVGGDTVAGIVATDLTAEPIPALLVDIGTNGELVLWDGERLTATSTAAGPAFEGARIQHGMHGAVGAIEKITVDSRLRYHVIGATRPRGICGSGLIDLAAELLRHGVLTPQGRLLPPHEVPAEAPADLRRRLIDDRGRISFLLAGADESASAQPIVVSQRDFRELQLAVGAIRAGIRLLLKQSGVRLDQLGRFVVAGGFGNYIRRENAQRIGLLPFDDGQRIRYEGNTSLAGARLAAVCRTARAAAERLARLAVHVDLSTSPDFAAAFAESMVFPDA